MSFFYGYWVRGKYVPWLSDHCVIKTVISLHGGEQTEIHPGFLWGEDIKSNFKKSFERPVISDKIESLLNSAGVSSVGLTTSIKEISFQNISDVGVRTKKSPSEENLSPNRGLIKNMKVKLSSLAKKRRQSPNDNAWRQK